MTGGDPTQLWAEKTASKFSRRRLFGILAAGVAGGAVIGGVVGALVTNGPQTESYLEVLPTAALSQTEGTLQPETKERLAEQARRCREPLARVAIWHDPATTGGTVSIISGSYHSPNFALTTTPSLVALPFPAPYAAGRGVLTVVGQASDLGIALRPGVTARPFNGALTIQVSWTPTGGCP